MQASIQSERHVIHIEPAAMRGVARPRRSRARLGRLLCAAWVISFAAACASAPRPDSVPPASTASAAAAIAPQRVAVLAKAGRFEPAEVRLVQGVPAVLEFTRVVDSVCMKAVRMPWMEEAVDLPKNEPVEIAVDTSMTGVFSYACSMGMVFGKVVIDRAD
jgi:plastocyanin